ncbi:TetR/AcrR family transcriptional regulator [Nocardia stercoris]|uniref:TetR/AcrR family transcriptional regulator n=1 Tax=Nocardia stercoris TaxID=2483361 RepID=UPI001F4704FC|nr:TetR/AcrR family transcriptional regulator [Nocardia stercoris]
MTAKSDSTAKRRPGRRIRGLDADQRADQRRDLLLETALELFARDGYAGTSIEALCQAAYVGNKAFYEHFSTKEACYLELLQRNTHTIVGTVEAALADLPDDEATGTRLLASALTHAVTDDPRIAAVTFGQAAGISPTIERQRRANRRQSATLVSALWRHYGTDGPHEHLAIAVVGGLFDLVSDALDRSSYAPTAADIDELIAQLTDFALVVRAGMRHNHNR